MRAENDPRQSTQPPPTPEDRPAVAVGPTRRVPVSETPARTPDVIVDFELDDDLLHVVVRNIGNGPAHRVRVAFEPGFHGASGISVPELALFHRLEFLAPGGARRAFVDAIGAYLTHGQPDLILATATFHDDTGRAYRRRVRHDLGIYRDLPRVHRRGG